VSAQHADDREQRADLHVRERFLHRFAGRGLLHGLAVLHEAGGDGPEAVPRLDRPLAHQDPAVYFDDTAGDDRADSRSESCRSAVQTARGRWSPSGTFISTGWPQAGQNFIEWR
jgi:hypothetical protein